LRADSDLPAQTPATSYHQDEQSEVVGYDLIAKAGPAGGAEARQAIGATAGALVITAAMLAIAAGHRSGRLLQVGRVAAFAERSGIPGWASFPLAFVAGSLFVAAFGMYWDIAIHLDEGSRTRPRRRSGRRT